MKRKHLVRLSSDDVTAEHSFYLTDAGLNLLLEVAKAFNAQARFSVDIRMEIDPTDSTTTGDAA